MQYLETVLLEHPGINELQNVERCAFVQVCGANRIASQYTYACGDKLYIAEKLKGRWQLREETDVTATAKEMQVLVGNSPFSNASFNLLLTKPEAMALFALLDHCRCQFLGELLGAGQLNVAATPEETADKAAQPLPGSLCNLFAIYAENTNANDVAEGLAGLTEKSLCEMKNGQYVLHNDFIALARGLVAIHNSALIQLWDGSGNSVRSLAGYVLQGGLHDILMTTLYGGDTVRVEAMSPQELLSVFEGVMACPELPGVEAEQASDAPVFCRNCGVKLDPGTAFCGNCGAKV